MIFKEKDSTTVQQAELSLLRSIVNLSPAEHKHLDLWESRMLKEEWGAKKPSWYLDPCVANQTRRHVIHDLRIAIDGEWVQFDHILWNYAGDFFLLKSKSYPQIDVDEFGACSAGFGQGMSEIIAPHLRLKRNEKRFLQLLRTPAFRDWVPFVNSKSYVLLPATSVLRVANEFQDVYLRIDAFIERYRRGIDKENTMTGSLTIRAHPQGATQLAAALMAMHTPRPTLRKQAGWESRPALLDIPEMKSPLIEHAKDWAWFHFPAAPSADLRTRLLSYGYQVAKENGVWTWHRPV